MDRRRAIEEAVHSGEMEGVTVTDAFRADMAGYIAGDMTLDEMYDRAMKRWDRTGNAPHALR